MINKEKVYAKIRKSGNLPTLPKILVKLLDACDNESTSLSEIAEIISKDPALSFKVLQLVNSAYYGLQTTFTSVEQAVIYLGADSVKNIAITTSVHQVFESKRFKGTKQLDILRFWWHSLMCATLAKRIASKTDFSNLDEAYLSGLLHDIGRLILISTYPKEHELILLKTESESNQLWAETQLIGINHCEAGAWLVNHWQLDSMMAEAIRNHHTPVDQLRGAFSLVRIVFVSNLLSEADNGLEHKYEVAEQLLGLNQDDLNIILEGAADEVSQIANSLDIKALPPQVSKNHRTQDLDRPLQNGNSSQHPLPDDPASDELEGESEDPLTEKVRAISLLSGVLENLARAHDRDSILRIFEESVNTLFSIDKVLFFLPDRTGVLLTGCTSSGNRLNHLSRGLALPLKKSTSLVVKTHDTQEPQYLSVKNPGESLADTQLLNTFRRNLILLMPITVENKSSGVALLGLPDRTTGLSRNTLRLIQILAQQIGLRLHMEETKQRRAEQIEDERKAAISMTARKFAHEVNNPLGIIGNYLTAISLKLPEKNDLQQEITIIREEISRISSMIDQMDMFSQAAFESSELIDLNTVLEDIVRLVKSTIFAQSDTTVSFQPDSTLPRIKISRDAIKQIMLNLLKNSSEALNDGGTVEIMTRRVDSKNGSSPTRGRGGLEITVRDNGPGLPSSIKANLFKPFFTTKENGHSGLGLSIIHKAVNDLGGRLSYTDRPEGGAMFAVYFPVRQE